jgi:hypothetical protein
MGVDRAAIYRWAHGKQGMNGPAKKLLEILLKEANVFEPPKEVVIVYQKKRGRPKKVKLGSPEIG